MVRTSLLPGLLKTLCANKHVPLPIKIFEIADVVVKDDTLERRARNQRMLSAIYCSKTSGFEVILLFFYFKFIHGILDRMMLMLGVPLVKVGMKDGYYIMESNSNFLF